MSVVVPTRDRAPVLSETIASILGQTWRDFELIVVSDGSTDDTEHVVRSFSDPRVRYIGQPASGGPAGPRNAGVAAARGAYVAFCDDDDRWRPPKLERQVALLEGRPEVALCYTGGIRFGNLDYLNGPAFAAPAVDDHFRRLLYTNFIAASSVMVRKRVLDEVGPFNDDPALRGTEDYELWLRIAWGRTLASVDAPLIEYRVHPANLSASRARATRRSIRVLRSLRDYGIDAAIARPLAWYCVKYAIYATLGR